MIEKNQIYQHYKGTLYLIKDTAIESNTKVLMIIYSPLIKHDVILSPTYCLPLEEFNEIKEMYNTNIKRFEFKGYLKV